MNDLGLIPMQPIHLCVAVIPQGHRGYMTIPIPLNFEEASILKSWFKYFDTNMNGIIEKQEFLDRFLAPMLQCCESLTHGLDSDWGSTTIW